MFGYADGSVIRHRVRAGDFGSYWRVGGQLAFSAPYRGAPLASVKLGIDGLDDYSLLRTRLLPAGAAARDAALAASLIGGALTLLLLSSSYHLLLARSSRPSSVPCHSAWLAPVRGGAPIWPPLHMLPQARPPVAATTWH